MVESMSAEQKAAVREYLSGPVDCKKNKVNIFLLGAMSTGRMCIMNRIGYDAYITQFDPTENYQRQMQVSAQEQKVMLELEWLSCDSPSDYRALIENMLRTTESFILVYDVLRRRGFEQLKSWHAELLAPMANEKPLFLFANKVDKPREEWVVSEDEGESFARYIGARFSLVSAPTGQGLSDGDFAEIAAWVILSKISGMNKTEAVEDPGPSTKQGRSRWSIYRLKEKVRGLLSK